MLSPDVGGSGYLGIIAVLFVLAAVAASVYLFCSYWRAWSAHYEQHHPARRSRRDYELERSPDTAVAPRLPVRQSTQEERLDDAPLVAVAASYCRSRAHTRWLDRPLTHIGRRATRCNFLVECSLPVGGPAAAAPSFADGAAAALSASIGGASPRLRATPCLLTLARMTQGGGGGGVFPPASPHGAAIAACMRELRHPCLLPCVDCRHLPDSGVLLVVQRCLKDGSIRDYIHGRHSPLRAYREKYDLACGQPVALDRIALWGRHVIEALRALQRAGIRCMHLHAGNVMVMEDGAACLGDIESTLLVCAPAPETAVALRAALHAHSRAQLGASGSGSLSSAAASGAAATTAAEQAPSTAVSATRAPAAETTPLLGSADHGASTGAAHAGAAPVALPGPPPEVEVLQFGRLLWEMAVGWPMESHALDLTGVRVHAKVARVLERIFTPGHPRRLLSVRALQRVALFKVTLKDAPPVPPLSAAAQEAVRVASEVWHVRWPEIRASGGEVP